jgi:prepilin-type N-terminal cleavage/methylation domain-containing protein
MRGFTLIEMVVYVAILALLTVGVIRLVLILSFNFAEIRAERRLMASSDVALETLVREVRLASAVATSSSIFGTSPGKLVLQTFRSPIDLTPVVRTFTINAARLTRQDDSGPQEFLTPPEVKITNLTFWHLATSTSILSTLKITIEAGQGKALESKTFYASAVLRQNY